MPGSGANCITLEQQRSSFCFPASFPAEWLGCADCALAHAGAVVPAVVPCLGIQPANCIGPGAEQQGAKTNRVLVLFWSCKGERVGLDGWVVPGGGGGGGGGWRGGGQQGAVTNRVLVLFWSSEGVSGCLCGCRSGVMQLVGWG